MERRSHFTPGGGGNDDFLVQEKALVNFWGH